MRLPWSEGQGARAWKLGSVGGQGFPPSAASHKRKAISFSSGKSAPHPPPFACALSGGSPPCRRIKRAFPIFSRLMHGEGTPARLLEWERIGVCPGPRADGALERRAARRGVH